MTISDGERIENALNVTWIYRQYSFLTLLAKEIIQWVNSMTA
jgi:hypothetical protein